MNLQLDHIVHFINRHPNEVVERLQQINVHAVMGGQHEQWGTFNSLLYLEKTYIEFLAIEDKEKAKESNNPLIKQLVREAERGEGVFQVCFRTDNISALKQMLEDKGFVASSIFEGSRKRSDGKIIQWKMLFVEDECPVSFPFFIEWNQSDHERLKDLKELGFISETHSKTNINSIEFVVPELEEIYSWAKMFDSEVTTTVETFSIKSASITISDCKIIFTQPTSTEGTHFKILKEKGARPFEISLSPNLVGEPVNLLGSSYL
ncbi:VOC family protein [Cytobacillus sp. FJAT-54145]|uniref:VOC family protein n=1 Tax=Cytobacillus spartinae TaxID=3299023 RepID=A0ABW6K7G1_9BACI